MTEPHPPEPQPPEPQWIPSAADIDVARITDFAQRVQERHHVTFEDYTGLWEWSVANLEQFWQMVWDYFGISSETAPTAVLSESGMPGAQWFPGATLNYVDQIARHASRDTAAIRYVREDGTRSQLTWSELSRQVGALAHTLRGSGVSSGDRVVGYLPNIPEAVVAFLATASIGAIWSACGQDYSASAALDRLGQLNPKVLITADGYLYGGKFRDKSEDLRMLRDGLATASRILVGEPRDRPIGRRRLRGITSGPRLPYRSTIRCGWCSRPARQACPRGSCTAMVGCCSNTSKLLRCSRTSAQMTRSSGIRARAG